jgi:Na+/melibiose symporter-like transporter
MGLKDVLHITNYQIMVVGAAIFAPLTIAARWLPSYAKQRIDFTRHAEGGATLEGEERPEPPTLRESFGVVKHNRWFIMGVILSFVTILAPGTDDKYLYRFLIPPLKIGKDKKTGKDRALGGETLMFIKNIIIPLPGTILQPFALRFIRKFGGELNMLRAENAVRFATSVAKYFVGYSSVPRLMFMYLMEMMYTVFSMWHTVPDNLVTYQMLDYVEWKTGLRSEGMTVAVGGFLNKIIRSNVNTVFSNAIKDWTGFLGYNFPREEQPENFIKSIWPLMCLKDIITGLSWLIGLLWFRFPADRAQVEADLIERRILEKKMKEEADA